MNETKPTSELFDKIDDKCIQIGSVVWALLIQTDGGTDG
jgi:hypothetical protein